jgi:hypothetical protein
MGASVICFMVCTAYDDHGLDTLLFVTIAQILWTVYRLSMAPEANTGEYFYCKISCNFSLNGTNTKLFA